MHDRFVSWTTAATRAGRRLRAPAALLAAAVVAIAATSAPAASSRPLERAELAAAPVELVTSSGDEDHFDHAAPEPWSPPVMLPAGRNELSARSPWAGRWGPDIEPLAAYEPQRGCIPGARPAVRAFAELLDRAYPQGRNLGITRSCEAGARSEHKEGRAYDWGLEVSTPAEREAAQQVLAWLLATDEHGNDFAMARRLGVMYVIWDNHIWSSSASSAGWRPYRGASPHTDHVHVSFTRAASMGQTSFWEGAAAGYDLGLGTAFARTFPITSFPDSFDMGQDRYRHELGERPGQEVAWDHHDGSSRDDAASGDAGSGDPTPGQDPTTPPPTPAPRSPAPTPDPAAPTVPLVPLPPTTVPFPLWPLPAAPTPTVPLPGEPVDPFGELVEQVTAGFGTPAG